jgi:ATP-dependent Clp protease ATP-binding subunit ClpB
MQKYLMDPLALKVLSGEFLPGDHIQADAAGDKLIFAKVLMDNTQNEKPRKSA